MIHSNKTKNFNRTTAHRKSMFDNLLESFKLHGHVETTLQKAKQLKGMAQSVMTDEKIHLVKTGNRKGDNADMALVASAKYLDNKFSVMKKNAKTNKK